jgi:hypothetical protein
VSELLKNFSPEHSLYNMSPEYPNLGQLNIANAIFNTVFNIILSARPKWLIAFSIAMQNMR